MITICKTCVMDSTIKNIKFDKDGNCNFCKDAKSVLKKDQRLKDNNFFYKIIDKIKSEKKSSSNYHCVCGISGGVDSSFLLHLLKKEKINPLVVHLDNGWNSKTAIKNIYNILDKLNFDLYTHVIEWDEFKKLQKSFLKSSIANLEIPSDHAIFSLLFETADKQNIKYILHGGNHVSESIMPDIWMESQMDQKLIYDVNKKFENTTLKTFPTQNYFDLFKRIYLKKIKYIGLLNYIDYNVSATKDFLMKEYNWEPYPQKHGESFFTHFFQYYILPKKYKIDKRKAHFSSLIVSKQMLRN
ncbi:N-acetyl sugar amidotransferase, partial [Candidatus Pelagibacter bacterium]|nr:N-acetyl sugar amidotransferase [Candidatus Pelagibacter bacterium]